MADDHSGEDEKISTILPGRLTKPRNDHHWPSPSRFALFTCFLLRPCMSLKLDILSTTLSFYVFMTMYHADRHVGPCKTLYTSALVSPVKISTWNPGQSLCKEPILVTSLDSKSNLPKTKLIWVTCTIIRKLGQFM